jgi:hypothetical protein
VDFPIPAAASGGVRVRWRAFSDGAWSDQDGSGDTDGLAAIDNILLTVSGGTTATDNFENATGSSVLNGRVIATENISGAVTWSAGGILGNTYDGWHLQFNPNYSNKGKACGQRHSAERKRLRLLLGFSGHQFQWLDRRGRRVCRVHVHAGKYR